MSKIAIIDSGIRLDHPFLKGINVTDFINLHDENADVDVTDNHGHGTAITGIIYSKAKTTQYVIIKIYDTELEATEEILVKALLYAHKLACDIIHLSLGCDYYNESIENCCNEIVNSGVLIVSAYSNEGSISYPAHFPCVIGVQSHELCKTAESFLLPENDVVDLFAKGGLHRVPWVGSSYAIQQGNSFSAAYLSGTILKQGWHKSSKDDILNKIQILITENKKKANKRLESWIVG